MKSALELLRKHVIAIVVALVVGLAAGLPLGWATVKVVNTTPAVMRADLQEDYLRMAINSFRVNRDPNLAVQRWDELGPAAAPLYVKVQEDPRGMDPAVIVAYGQVIQAVKGENPGGAGNAPLSGGFPSRTLLIVVAIFVLFLVGAAILYYLLRRTGRTPSGNRPSGSACTDSGGPEPRGGSEDRFRVTGSRAANISEHDDVCSWR